jgi:Ca2+-binding RTX toxin-like protein
MTTVQDAYINALLADAAYVNDLEGLSRDDLILQLQGRMTPKLAKYIGDNFSVVAQVGGLASSFDATVWRDRGRQIYVSMRGTQGGTDIAADLDLATSGLPHEQLADMVNWWLRATTPALSSGGSDQYATQIRVMPNNDFALGSAVPATGELAGFSAIKSANGHSLGGYLASAFVRLFGNKWPVETINTFNSAGFSKLAAANIENGFNQIAQQVGAALGLGSFSSAQNNYFGQNGINVTTNTWDPVGFAQYGTRIGLFQEDLSPGTIDNHYIYKITDLLALGDALEWLDPTMNLTKLSALVSAGSNQMVASYESVLDALRGIFSGADVTPTLRGDANGSSNAGPQPPARLDYHAKLNALETSAAFQAWAGQVTVVSLTHKSADEIKTLAQSDISYRYALKTLNPFAITGAPGLYDPFSMQGQLALSSSSQTAGMTDEYLTDRAQMVAFLATANINDTNAFGSNQVSDQVLYQDLVKRPTPESQDGKPTQVLVFLPGGTPNFRGPNTRVVGFGTDSSEALLGRDNTDRLYGGMGSDLLQGGKGNDYLEGGAGMDLYAYSAETNIFSPNTNDGDDEIRDTDGKGVIGYTFTGNGTAGTTSRVIGGAALKVTAAQWRSPDGKFTYDQQGSTGLLVTINGDAGGSIMIRDFDFAKAAQGGYLGIRLVDEPVAPTTALDILGDREIKNYTVDVLAEPNGEFPEAFVFQSEWLDVITSVKDRTPIGTDPNTGETIYQALSYTVTYHLNDAQGNRERTDVEQANATDELFDSALNDRIVTGGSEDRVEGTRGGSDRIDAGAGRDWVRAGAGADWVEGGANGEIYGTGGDLLEGGAGNDALFGGTAKPISQAIANGELGGATTDRGEYINAGAGDDIAVGGDKADVLFGAGGADLLVGGAGDDFLNGDLDYLLQETSDYGQVFQWQVQVAINGASRQDIYPGFTGSESPDAGADLLYGGAGNDVANGGGGNDYIELGTGEDWGYGEAGDDSLLGGADRDILVGDRESLALAQHGEDYLDGGAGDDLLFGNGGADFLIGGQGEDQLQGGEGDDVLYGGTEADVLLGGTGKDTYIYYRGDGVDVVIDPDIATDSQYRSALALGPGITKEQVKFRLGSLMIDLGQGDAVHFDGFNADDPASTPVLDSIQFADGDFMTFQDVLDQGFDLDGTEADDYIKGTAVTDRIDAKGGNDIIEAGSGNDLIVTGEGADIVFGNAGDDRIVAGDADLVIDVEGQNTLDLTGYAGLAQANLELTQYRAPDGDTYLNFHMRDDLNPGVTPATGGVSVQYGEIGNFASVTVSDGAEGTVELSYEELMTQYAGHGLVYSGQAAAETLVGTPFADTFFGQGGADTIQAGAGEDKLDGGAGEDTLEGGVGNDTYLLGYNRGRDTVIEDGAAEPNATHTILLDAGIPSSLVTARQAGDDLEVRLRATGDALVLKDFYLQPQSWQDGWQVRDSNGALTDLADHIPVIPPQAASWLEEEEQAYRARREQVFAANRQADGFLPLGGNVFQHTEQVFNYAGASVDGSTTTLSLVAETQSSDAGQIAALTQFTSTPIGVTNATVDIGLPVVQGTGGERTQASAEIGTGGAGSGGSFEFFPITPGGGGGFQLNPGDYAVPVYGPRFGSAQGLRNAGVLNYASAGGFNDSTQWRVIGYNVFRVGSGGSSPESVAAIASYQNYDQHLTVQDVEAGGSTNTVTASSSVVDGGAGDDSIALGTGYFFAGPDWEGTFDLSDAVDEFSPSAAQDRYRFRHPGLSGFPFLYPARTNQLGGFALGADGDDAIEGSVGQDVIAGGNGADLVDGAHGSDRVLVGAADVGIDALADSGIDSFAYLDYYYWSRGVLNWDERAAHGNEWRMDADGGDYTYFDTAEEALASQSYGAPVFIAPLSEAAPVLTRDDPLYDDLVAAGVLAQDVLEFGSGLLLQDLDISVRVDTFSAQDNPDRPWINGGRVSIRWGPDSGVDFDVGRLDGGHEGADLFSGGWQIGDETAPDGTWFGYRLGVGFEAFRFADGTTRTLDQLLAGATVEVDESQNYAFHRDAGYQLIHRRYAAIEMADGIAANEVAVTRDDRDLLISVAGGYPAPGAQGRIRDWYADPNAMPGTSLLFDADPAFDAAGLTQHGLEAHGTNEADSLLGLDGFADRLHGEGGEDTLLGGSGDDTLVGGGAADYLDGGAGADSYFFDIDDGQDVVADAGPSVILFGQDIFNWEVGFGLGSLVVNYGDGDSIRFIAFDADDPYATPVFDRLEFADGSKILYQDLLANGFYLAGTEADDIITGTGVYDQILGNGGNDTLSGRGDHDDLYGGEGDDTLAGGPGDNDSLAGDEGADTYIYAAGDGRDDIFERDGTPGEVDRVLLQGIEAADVRVTRDPWNYFLVMAGGDRLSLGNMPLESAAVLERIEFEDGTVWTPADLAARVELLPATEGDDVLWGTAANDTISGLGGFDALCGNLGDDFLSGGEGGDFYYFSAGDGQDVIDNVDTDGSPDSIQFAHAVSTNAVLSRSSADLVLTLGPDSVKLAGWYADASRRIDSIYFEADGAFWDAAMIEQLAPAGGNSAPQVSIPLVERSFEAGTAFEFLVSPATFIDPDAGDVLALSATLYNGGTLPAWLTFDPSSGAFAGLPQASNVGISHVAVTATDASGESATSEFGLIVRAAAGSAVTGGAADDVIYGGTGDETLVARGGSDYVYGDVGDDVLRGGNGNDVLQGGAGSDVLRGGAGQNVLDGGAGDDLIYGGAGSAFIAGGAGNDILRVGRGNDVIAFNAGDGMDTVYGGRDGGNTLSFGGGIRYSDIRLSKSGKDLLVSTGAGEGLTLKNWYGGNHSVLSLQVMLDATAEFDAASGDPLYNRRVQTLDFLGMVGAFDAARTETPGLTSWEITNALLAFHLSGADDAALGGDLAYWYGKNRTLAGISLQSAQQVIGAPGFGSEAQSLRPFSGLQEGFVKLA